jgi:hypothetical protein
MSEGKSFSWKKDLIVPAVLLLFAGLVGVGVGYIWEFFKFKRETLFEKKIEMIIDSRRQVADFYVEFDRLRRQIDSDERQYATENDEGTGTCDPEKLQSEREELKVFALRINYLNDFSQGLINKTEAKTNIDSFNAQLKEYHDCLEKNTGCETCTKDRPHLMEPLQKIIDLHTAEILNQIKLND